MGTRNLLPTMHKLNNKGLKQFPDSLHLQIRHQPQRTSSILPLFIVNLIVLF